MSNSMQCYISCGILPRGRVRRFGPFTSRYARGLIKQAHSEHGGELFKIGRKTVAWFPAGKHGLFGCIIIPSETPTDQARQFKDHAKSLARTSKD